MAEEITTVYLPEQGELGIGAGPLWDGVFHSVVWFPADAMAEALEFCEGGDWVVREGVAF
jgi:hypothetical protein